MVKRTALGFAFPPFTSLFYGVFHSFTDVVASYVKDKLIEFWVYGHTCCAGVCVMSHSHRVLYLINPRFFYLLGNIPFGTTRSAPSNSCVRNHVIGNLHFHRGLPYLVSLHETVNNRLPTLIYRAEGLWKSMFHTSLF